MTILKTLKQPDLVIEDKNGKQYSLAALSFKQLGEYIYWWQFREYTEAKRLNVDKDLLEKIYDRCRDKKLGIEHPEIPASMLTPEGISKLVYLMLKPNHPEITEDKVADLVDLTNIDLIANDLLKQAGYITAEETTDEPGE